MISSDAYLIIIGAMKAGTTTLFNHLATHPQISPSKVKEPDFFLDPSSGDAAASQYERLWSFNPAQHVYAMEASTNYAKHISEGVPERMSAYGLKPKFIYVLRDPLDRIESEHNFLVRTKTKWPISIGNASSVQCSNYIHYIDMYEQVFGEGSIQLIDFEELVQRPLDIVNMILRSLNLDELEALEEGRNDNATASRSPLEAQLIGPFRPLVSRIPDRQKATLTGMMRPLISRMSGKTPYQKLTPSQRHDIQETLAPGMARLAARGEIDVAKWGFET